MYRSFINRLQNKRVFPYILLLPALVVLIMLIMFPFIYNVWQSMHNYNLVYPQEKAFVGIQNFVKIFATDDTFWHALKMTVYFVGAALIIELMLGLGIALLINEEFKGQYLVRLVLMLPLAATPVAVSYMWRIMYNPTQGIINYFLRLLHLPSWSGIFDYITAMPSIIIVDIWQWTPFMSLIILAGLMSLPQEPIEASRVDGATPNQTFWYVTLPLLKPVIAVGILLRTIDLFKTFDIIYALTGGGPGRATETLNVHIYLSAFRSLEIGYATAMTLIALIIITILCTVFIRIARIET